VDILLPGGTSPIISSTTTADGLFAFIGVPPGNYDVVVTASGFRKATERGGVLEAGKELALPTIRLELGSTTETVEVKESALAVQTTNSEISTNVSHSQVQDLPILNRSPQGFVSTQLGANIGRNGVTIVNGQRTTFTNVSLDGINIEDNY